MSATPRTQGHATATAGRPLEWHERLYYRDQLRAARYAALADAEGFHAVCFALEALGMRLLNTKGDLGRYAVKLRDLALDSTVLSELTKQYPGHLSRFDALFALVKNARNDAMHTGVYARHATAAAIEVCIGLEEALMKQTDDPRTTVADYMVKSAVTVESWQPVAHARQLMLAHSFSFLPVLLGGWKLISETAMARYLRGQGDWKNLMSASIQHAATNGLKLLDADVVRLDDDVFKLLNDEGSERSPGQLWLVEDSAGRLCGVLSPFELM